VIFGFISVEKSLGWRIFGRIVGETADKNSNKGSVMTFMYQHVFKRTGRLCLSYWAGETTILKISLKLIYQKQNMLLTKIFRKLLIDAQILEKSKRSSGSDLLKYYGKQFVEAFYLQTFQEKTIL
jgi:hypothetical protein